MAVHYFLKRAPLYMFDSVLKCLCYNTLRTPHVLKMIKAAVISSFYLTMEILQIPLKAVIHKYSMGEIKHRTDFNDKGPLYDSMTNMHNEIIALKN